MSKEDIKKIEEYSPTAKESKKSPDLKGSKIRHFIILLVLALICFIFVQDGRNDPYHVNIVHHIAYAYLALILFPGFIIASATFVVISVLPIISSMDIYPYYSLIFTLIIIITGALNLWFISGIFAGLRNPKRDKKQFKTSTVKKIIIPLILIILIFIGLWQLGAFNVGRKPAIYLYPTADMDVNVSIHANGFVTKSIPQYNSIWQVHAKTDGSIDDRYDYLYYEVALRNLERPPEGWVVEYKDLDEWFSVNLPELGLNPKESMQFREYWVNELPPANFYQIGLLSDGFLESDMALEIKPEPDTEIRLIFYFKPLDEKITLKEPQTTKKEREGFTIVEWGGVVDLPLSDRIWWNLDSIDPFKEG